MIHVEDDKKNGRWFILKFYIYFIHQKNYYSKT
jgi:hypothetical protein